MKSLQGIKSGKVMNNSNYSKYMQEKEAWSFEDIQLLTNLV